MATVARDLLIKGFGPGWLRKNLVQPFGAFWETIQKFMDKPERTLAWTRTCAAPFDRRGIVRFWSTWMVDGSRWCRAGSGFSTRRPRASPAPLRGPIHLVRSAWLEGRVEAFEVGRG